MPKVKLPPGCSGFNTSRGVTVKADKPGGTVDLDDSQAKALGRSQYASTGFITAPVMVIGTKRGMRCPACNRMWQAWTTRCNSCGTPAVPDL